MKKIMFNDRFGLTKAVLDGTKTMTRRAVGNHMTNDDIAAYLKGYKDVAYNLAPYKIGEIVAVAQSYKDLGYTKEWVEQHISPNPNAKPTDPFEKKYPGWFNKMFVCADFMPHQIRITDIKVERLQDISDEDCLKEGIFIDENRKEIDNNIYAYDVHGKHTCRWWFPSAKLAFSTLIERPGIGHKGDWSKNPWVFVYCFNRLNIDKNRPKTH